MRKMIAVSLALAGMASWSLATSTGASAVPTPGPTASGPCGTRTLSGTPYRHIVWVWMENHSYSSIIGSPQAPYINALASHCGLATNYHNISHPSLPNYIAGTSGLSVSAVQKFAGDCSPGPGCTTSAKSIFGQGESWKAYDESMPADCSKIDSGEYAVRHNPAVYYTTLTNCQTDDVPYYHLAADLAANRLPAFSFITPNLIDDMHDGTVAQGNAWLAKNLPVIFNSSEYKAGTVAVIVTWDEGEGGVSSNCPTNVTDIGCHVATIVASPTTPAGTKTSALFNHWSLLRATEQLLGLPPLGAAATATSMSGPFKL
jgi:hypothetical protein